MDDPRRTAFLQIVDTARTLLSSFIPNGEIAMRLISRERYVLANMWYNPVGSAICTIVSPVINHSSRD